MQRKTMNKNTLKGILNKSDLTEKQKKIVVKLWDSLYLWAGYDGYYTQTEIARQLGINRNTLKQRMLTFEKQFPEAYELMKTNRNIVKRASARHYESIRNPSSFDKLKEAHGDNLDGWIVEKY